MNTITHHAPTNPSTERLASWRISSALLIAALMALSAPACGGDDGDDGEDLSAVVDDETISVLAIYRIEGDDLLGDVDPEHEVIWTRFAQLFPATTRPEVKFFVPIDVEASGGTDGAMQLSALDKADYYLALDTTGGVPLNELERTMIHEFGHLVTLRPSQVPRDEAAIATCDVFTDSDGCPAENSYLRAYFEEFWPGYLGSDLENEGEQAAGDRFATGDFVTEYAATIPTEDVAEVFAEWVLAADSPTGETTLEKKLRFFDDYSEVVTLRGQIKSGI